MPPDAETGAALFDVHVLDVPSQTPSGEDFGDAFAAAFGVERRVADALILGVPMRVKRALPRGAADEMVATLDALGAIAQARPAEIAAVRGVVVSVPNAAPRLPRSAPVPVPVEADDAPPPPSLEEPPSLQVLPPPKRAAAPPEPEPAGPPPAAEEPRTVDGPRDDFDEPESGEALSLDLGASAPPKDARPSGRSPAADANAPPRTTGGAEPPPPPPAGAPPRPAFALPAPPPAKSFEVPFVAKLVVGLAIVGGIAVWAVGWMRSYSEMRTLSGMPRNETWCAREDCLGSLKIPKDKRGTKLTLVATWRDECPEAYLAYLEKLADTHPGKLGVVAVAAVHRVSNDPKSWGRAAEAEPTLWPSPQCQPRFFALPPGDGTLRDDLPRPATYLFGDDGRLVAVWRGGLSEADQERLSAWLKKEL